MGVNSKYILGNAKSIKEIFNNNKIRRPNLIISSPPYFDVLNYNNNEEQIGYGQTDYNEYLNDVCNIFQDCYDLSDASASFWLIVDTFKKDANLKLLPFDIANNLKSNHNQSWILKEVIIWDKEKNLPWNGHGHFKNQFEYILFFTKTEDFYFSIDEVREINDLKKWWKSYPERYNPSGKAPSNVWNYTTAIRGWGNNKQEHLCPLPFPLLEKIITISSKPGDLILDPFAGSGSLLALGKLMGRNTIGIDVNKDYKKLFDKKIKIGAKEYWGKRNNELNQNKEYIENFKSTNRILRIHKVAAAVSEELATENPELPFKPIVFTLDIDATKFTLFIYVKTPHDFDPIFNYSESLQKLIRQAKVTPELVAVNESQLRAKLDLSKNKFYKYSKTNIYRYNSTISSKTLLQNDHSTYQGFIFSIFALKIQ